MRVSGLVKRGEIFYFRRRVPSALIALVAKPVIIRTLDTKALVLALKRHAQRSLELDRIFAETLSMSKLDPELAKNHFHKLLRHWMGKDGSLPIPAEKVELIEARLRNDDDELRDIGIEHIQAVPELQQAISYSDVPQVEALGSLLLRTCLEHAKQSLAQQQGTFDGKAIDPYFDGALMSSGGNLGNQTINVSSSSATQSPVPPLTGSLEETFEAFMQEANYNPKRTYRFNGIYRIVADLFGTKPFRWRKGQSCKKEQTHTFTIHLSRAKSYFFITDIQRHAQS